MKAVARAAASAATNAAANTSDRASIAAAAAATTAASAARTAATTAATTTAAATTAGVADLFATFSALVWPSVHQDCKELEEVGLEVMALPLWSDGDNPLEAEWADVKANVPQSQPGESAESARTEDWSFWIAWYQGELDGKPLPEELLLKITQKPPEFWDRGPEHVNPILTEMWREFGLAASYNAERLERDGEDGLIKSVQETALRADDFEEVLERLSDAAAALRDCPAAGNMSLGVIFEAELEQLETSLERYGHRAIRIYEACIDVGEQAAERARDNGLETDVNVRLFLRQLERSGTDILASDAHVERKVRGRASVRFERMNEGERERLRQITAAARDEFKPDLAQEAEEDLTAALDEGGDAQARDDARYRLGGRLLRADKLKREELVKAADDATKVGRAMGGAWGFVTEIIKWFV